MTTYKSAGVNIGEADRAVELFSKKVRATYEGAPGVTFRKSGQFAGLVHFDDVPEVDFGFSIDGIGTKLLIALQLNRFDTVGECLVGHCINDLLTAGIRARVLLDYVATAGLKAETTAAIVNSIADACIRHGIVLVGGETAEMPQVYIEGAYDMVACVQGFIKPEHIIDGSAVKPGDSVWALPSSGCGCNGFSLLRKVNPDFSEIFMATNRTIGDVLLTPTRSYEREIFAAIDAGCEIHGMANITGGGIPGNLSRIIPDECVAHLEQAAIEPHIPAIMTMTQERGDVPWDDMVNTFNLGVGFIVVLPEASSQKLMDASKEEAFKIGTIDAYSDPTIEDFRTGTYRAVQFDGSWGSF